MRSWSRSSVRRLTLLVSVMALVVANLQGAWAVTTKTTRVSVRSSGAQANGHSLAPAISDTGRFIAFISDATNLVGGDNNGVADVFVRDRRADTTRRISLNSRGNEANGASDAPSISADGRFVAFESDATNLVGNDKNGDTDIFVRDRVTRATTRISLSSTGVQGNGNSSSPSISADGRFVAFTSDATNLVPGDTKGHTDVFIRDLENGLTRRVSVSSSEAEGNGLSYMPSISKDGSFVAFSSFASNLVGADTNATYDIFVRDRRQGTTRRVSVSSLEEESEAGSVYPSISASGRFVAFQSDAANLVLGDLNGSDDVFVRDRGSGLTTRVSVSTALAEGNGDSLDPSISASGRSIAFVSAATNLVGTEDTNNLRDIYAHDRRTGITSRVSVNTPGTIQANAHSFRKAISGDGRFVVFETVASSLIEGDTNGYVDIFLRGPLR